MSRDEIKNGKRKILSREEVEKSVIISCDTDNIENLIDWIMDLQEQIITPINQVKEGKGMREIKEKIHRQG